MRVKQKAHSKCKIYVFLTVVCLLMPVVSTGQSLQESTVDTTLSRERAVKSPRAAMLRCIVPGWGQLYNGQLIKAIIVAGGQSALLYYALDYNSNAGREEKGSTAYNFYIDRRNLMFWFMGGVTLLSMLDAFIDAHLYNFDTDSDLSLRIGVIPGRHGNSRCCANLGLALRLRF